jgi:hypothetical protein
LTNQFKLAVAVAVPYRELNERLSPLVEGLHVGDGGSTLTISHLVLGNASGHVLARVEARGALNGALYLWGTPAVVEHDAHLLLAVPDLHAALETRSTVERIKLALWRLVGGSLERLLRAKLALDVTERVRDLRAALSGRHALLVGPPALTLTTSFDSIRPGEVESRDGAAVIYPVLTGSAELSLQN